MSIGRQKEPDRPICLSYSPRRFQLVINLKAAKVLGLDPSLSSALTKLLSECWEHAGHAAG
jgi:hypothetical protein